MVTEHGYEQRGSVYLKETHWWLMKAESNQRLIPQAEEEITELRWIGVSELPQILSNTFPNIIDVLKAAKIPGI
jgi:hypothetical protein